ncbi:MAG: hypothetical protein JW718_07890 [Desulfovibrionaceae bacterium]|nr:hypothetical protein [Desulfovibrionaceae bacterium]
MNLFFPCMHVELWPLEPVTGARFLDPGLAAPDQDMFFRPPGMPIDASGVRRVVDECLRFGEQFARPGELAWFSVGEPGGFNRAESRSVQDELLARVAGGALSGALEERRVRAHMALLLAWAFEERLVDVIGLERGMQDSWRRFGDALGLEPDPSDSEALELNRTLADLNATVSAPETLPWRIALESWSMFLPPGVTLLTVDPEIREAWIGAGLEFSPAPAPRDPLIDPPKGCLVAEESVWRLSGRGRPDDLGLLDTRLRVALLGREETG